jgi:Ni,Fe-hydrogenase III component G
MSNSNVDLISLVESKFGSKIQVQRGQVGDAAITANNGLHYDVLKAMIEADEKTGVTAITGLDFGANLGVYYHIHTSKPFITIKAEVPKDNPKIKTVVDIHPGALFHELEVTDLFGVIFEGNEFNGHFVLSENWPDGVYPLRKDRGWRAADQAGPEGPVRRPGVQSLD